MQWLKDYMAEIDGPGGPGLNLKQVHISACLEGPALEWYSHDLESRAKTTWPLFPRAFIARWKPLTFDIRAVKVPPKITLAAAVIKHKMELHDIEDRMVMGNGRTDAQTANNETAG